MYCASNSGGRGRASGVSPVVSTYPAISQKAPEFTAPVTGAGHPQGSTVTLSALKGEQVVLYFYPKDDTPGCTRQACALRDEWQQIASKARVFGISPDPLKRHEKFIQKYSLPFPLISDEDHAIGEAYGVWVEKSLYGRKYMGMERTTVIIGPDGKVRAVLPRVKPEEHLSLVLSQL